MHEEGRRLPPLAIAWFALLIVGMIAGIQKYKMMEAGKGGSGVVDEPAVIVGQPVHAVTSAKDAGTEVVSI